MQNNALQTTGKRPLYAEVCGIKTPTVKWRQTDMGFDKQSPIL